MGLVSFQVNLKENPRLSELFVNTAESNLVLLVLNECGQQREAADIQKNIN